VYICLYTVAVENFHGALYPLLAAFVAHIAMVEGVKLPFYRRHSRPLE
jgi:hypothetical protein